MSDGIESQNLRRVMRRNMSDKPTRSGGGSGLATLPEWPEDGDASARTYQQEIEFLDDMLTAALARMEALVEYAQHTGAWCSQGMGHACTCGLSELLAACERRGEA